MNYTWDELRKTPGFETLTWDSLGQRSPHYEELLRIVGPSNAVDVQHLDSALSTGCDLFLTSDKDDLCSKAGAIQALTGLRVLHVREDWQRFLELLEGAA